MNLLEAYQQDPPELMDIRLEESMSAENTLDDSKPSSYVNLAERAPVQNVEGGP